MKLSQTPQDFISAQTTWLSNFLGYDLKDKDDVPGFVLKEHFKDMNSEPILYPALENHFFNCQLWKFEDLARDSKASDTQIAEVKRTIDKLNQRRNNKIEEVNQNILSQIKLNESGRLVSETPGSIVDRLSIMSLKIFHMNKFAKEATTEEFKMECEEKLKKLESQRNDLKTAMETLFQEFHDEKSYFKTYFQYKTYNDKRFNKLIK